MLQESYNLNTSQLAEGVIEEGSKKFDSHYKFSCLDKFHIGVVASNLGWLDTAIEWFDHALNNANPNDKGPVHLIRTPSKTTFKTPFKTPFKAPFLV